MSLFARYFVALGLLLVVVGVPLLMLLHDSMGMVRQEVWVIAGSLVLLVLAGLVHASVLTVRLKRLANAMDGFRAGGFTRAPNLAADVCSSDELGRLARDLEAMAARMLEHLNDTRRADTDRRELIANISHDLRTPLAAMRGYLDTLLIQDDTLTPQQRQTYLGVAVEEAERLTRLVADLFEMAKLDAPNASLALEPCALSELMQDVAQKFELPAQSRGVTLHAEIPHDAPWADADIAAMERVFSNLLDNALRHTPEGGSVTLALIPTAERLRVDVRDTGSGLRESDRLRVFDRFWRADAHRSGSGAGLGLAIARRIVELHGGNIEVDSAPGKGACFHFDLPIHKSKTEETS